MICSIEGCGLEVRCRGWCALHYQRWRRHGDAADDRPRNRGPAEMRFWRLVSKSDGCWIWTGRLTSGYGRFAVISGHPVLAHRYAYEQLVGSIPDGLGLDHLCRVRHCVNPAHLEPVTNRENLRRSPITLGSIADAKTHCPQGHLYGPKREGKSRICNICARDLMRRKRAKGYIAPSRRE